MLKDHTKQRLNAMVMTVAVALLCLGGAVLVGWYLHDPALIQINPAFAPMQYNTALGFALSGGGLLALARSLPRTAFMLGLIVLSIGVATLIEYLFEVDLGIDQLLMEHDIVTATSHPGRMAPNTALCFTLTGLAVLIAGRFNRRHTPLITALLGAMLIGLGFVALTGYFTGIESAYGWGHLTRMAIHTSAGFIVLGLGFTALAWRDEKQLQPDHRFPSWLPIPIGMTGLTVTLALWQALKAYEQKMIETLGSQAISYSDEGMLLFGVLMTTTLMLVVWMEQSASEQARRTTFALTP